jgi:hypothetical protein
VPAEVHHHSLDELGSIAPASAAEIQPLAIVPKCPSEAEIRGKWHFVHQPCRKCPVWVGHFVKFSAKHYNANLVNNYAVCVHCFNARVKEAIEKQTTELDWSLFSECIGKSSSTGHMSSHLNAVHSEIIDANNALEMETTIQKSICHVMYTLSYEYHIIVLTWVT